MSVPVGPYCDPDMEDWWVPVAAEPNRMRAASLVREFADPGSKVVYRGRDTTARLDPEHEGVCTDLDGNPEPHVYVGPAWHFEAVERWR